MIRRPAALDSVASLGASAAGFLLGIPTSILIARAVGPAGKGIVTLTQTIVAQGIIFSLGVEAALVHAAGRPDSDLRKLSGTALKIAIVMGPLASIAGVAFLVFGAADVGEAAVRYWMLLSMVAIPLLLGSGYLHSLLVASGRIAEVAGLGASRSLLTLFAALVALTTGSGVAGFLALNLVGVAAITLLTGLVAFRARILPPERDPHRGLARGLISFGLKGHLGTVLHGLNNRLDVFMISAFLTPSALGLYSVAVTAAETLLLVPTFLGDLILQRSSSDASEEAGRFTSLATRITSLVLVVGALILGLVGGWMIELLFGAEFAAASGALLWLLPGIWALGIWRNMTNHLMGRGFPLYKTKSAAAAAVITIALDVLLVPRLGIKGAAVASTCAYATAFLVALVPYCRITGRSVAEVIVPKRADLSAVGEAVRTAIIYVRKRPSVVEPDTFYEPLE